MSGEELAGFIVIGLNSTVAIVGGLIDILKLLPPKKENHEQPDDVG